MSSPIVLIGGYDDIAEMLVTFFLRAMRSYGDI